MKKIIIMLMSIVFGITVHAAEEPEQLYAQSAVLMDADSGRILFEKNGREQRPMASTTKIMTCILALEQGNLERVVTASESATKQPQVKLGVNLGEMYRLEDLLYSLMLESHNDSAVMIAELVGGSVEEFSNRMNQKAKEIGCEHTYFITPNGLDASDDFGKHSTTACDLAKIMRYCIAISEKRKEFIELTRTEEYTFMDVEQKREYHCRNHNAFLKMMEGALSGKTGFTGEAGYCYVGALKRENRTFIVSLLGCGWPNNRTYKWSDTKRLMQYGLENYMYKKVELENSFPPVKVKNGVKLDGWKEAKTRVALEQQGELLRPILAKEEEQIFLQTNICKEVEAPVKKGDVIGEVLLYLDGELFRKYKMVAVDEVKKITYKWCVERIFMTYFKFA